MTKETILRRLLLENHITVEELITLAKEKDVFEIEDLIDCDKHKSWSPITFKTTPYHQSPNIVSSKL